MSDGMNESDAHTESDDVSDVWRLLAGLRSGQLTQLECESLKAILSEAGLLSSTDSPEDTPSMERDS